MKKYLLLGLMAVLTIVTATACSSDKDDDKVLGDDSSAIYGKWKCVDAKVLDIDLGDMSLPSSAEDMIKKQIEDDMIGQTVNIDRSDIRVDGDVVIFNESGIRWHVLSLTDRKLRVSYDVESSYASFTLKMKVEATFDKL